MENNTNDWTIGDHLENFNNPHEVTKAQVGLGNVDNVRQYSELNPPPNHINTVCGKGPDANGDIDLVKGDVNLGKVDNVKQYSEKNPPPYPVTSVNGQTGAVNIALPDTSGLQTAVNTHTANVCNPHQVTKDQVGLGNVDNVRQYSAQNQPPYPVTSVNGLTGAVTVEVPDVSGMQTDLGGHIANVNNPHGVTKAQIGLGNVDNTSDLAKPVSTATQSALDSKLNAGVYTAADVLNKIKTVDGAGSGLDADLLDGRNAANAANSIPILDATGKLPVAQIPTGATASTVSLGNHGHSNYAASSHSHSNYAASGHGHSYLPLAGGTVTGATNFTSVLRKSGLDVATMKRATWTPVAGGCKLTGIDKNVYTQIGKHISGSFQGLITPNGSSGLITFSLPHSAPTNALGTAVISFCSAGFESTYQCITANVWGGIIQLFRWKNGRSWTVDGSHLKTAGIICIAFEYNIA